ncbi:Uncharacterised protein [Actinobacillus pleuropneumoniae]|nr:Uncharacterised protein [Actinobacillus pleuropneumoniae]
MTSLAPLGPPSVMTKMRSKYFKEPTTASTIVTLITSMMSGSLIRNAIWREVAPSILAASTSEAGIFFKAA